MNRQPGYKDRKAVAILGYGHIGKAIANLLKETGLSDALDRDSSYSPSQYSIYDKVYNDTDLTDRNVLRKITSEHQTVFCATPFQLNPEILRACVETGTDYYDLTEDVGNNLLAISLSKEAEQNLCRLVPQCGLAPGMVGIIGNYIAGTFSSCESLKIRVGALHNSPSNMMRYHQSWSVDGLINEYCNNCVELVDGELKHLRPLTEVEKVLIDGVEFEAARTSGGIGSLPEYLANSGVKNVNYKTLRWPGHWHLMQFLLEDLKMDKNKDLFIDLFKKNIAYGQPYERNAGRGNEFVNDRVYIQITGEGYSKKLDKKIIRSYNNVIKPGHGLDSISRTTACGLLYVYHYLSNRNGKSSTDLMMKLGYINQAELPFREDAWAYAKGYTN